MRAPSQAEKALPVDVAEAARRGNAHAVAAWLNGGGGVDAGCIERGGATLLMERWANPLFELGLPTGLRARTCAAMGLMLTWIAIADQQLCAHLLLLLFTSRRTLVHFPAVEKAYALCIKLYALVHMSRVLTHKCDAIPKLAVATVAAMAVL